MELEKHELTLGQCKRGMFRSFIDAEFYKGGKSCNTTQLIITDSKGALSYKEINRTENHD